MLTSSTDTDDGPRVLALERHQDVAGAQIGGVGVPVAALSGETRSASVLGRLPRWMRIVKCVESDRNVTRLPKKPGSVSDEMRKFDTGPLNRSSDSIVSSYGCGCAPTAVATGPPPASSSVPGTRPVIVYAGR